MSLVIATVYTLGMTLLLFRLVDVVCPESLASILLITIFICLFVLTTQVRIHNWDMKYKLNGKFWKVF
jgi:hypothetical protein